MNSKSSGFNTGTSSLLLLVGVIAGIIVSGYFPKFMQSISIIGQFFFYTLTVFTAGVIISSVIANIANFPDMSRLRTLSFKSLVYFGLFAIVGTAIAWIVGVLIPVEVAGGSSRSFLSTLSMNAARNPFGTYGNLIGLGSGISGRLLYLSLVVTAILFGSALIGTRSRNSRSFKNILLEINDNLLRAFRYFMYVAPLGVFALVGSSLATHTLELPNILEDQTHLLLGIVLVTIIFGLLVLPITLWLFTRRSPFIYFYNLFPALFTSFGTGSSSIALAVTYENTANKNQVDKRAASLMLPAGTLFNVGPTAMIVLVALIIIGRLSGSLDLNLSNILVMSILSILLSVGITGMPGLLILMIPMVIGTAGSPETAIGGLGLLPAIWLASRLRAMLNVACDAVGAAMLGESFELKTVGRKTKETATRAPRERKERPDRRRDTRDSRDSRDRGRSQDRKRPDRSRSRSDSRTGRESREGRERRESSVRRDRRDRPETTPHKQSSPFTVKTDSSPNFEAVDEKPVEKQEEKRPPRNNGRYNSGSRPAPVQRKTEEPVENKDKAPKEDILENENFKKELARVSAHLQAMEDKEEAVPEETASGEIESPFADAAIEEDQRGFGSEPSDFAERDLSYADDDSDALEKELSEDIAPGYEEGEDTEDIIDDSEDESEEPIAVEEAKIEYGRGRNRHGKDKDDDFPIDENKLDDLPEPEDTFSNENISFGRSKKKKPRM